MLVGLSADIHSIFALAGATVLGAFILGAGKAVMGLIRSSQTKKRNEESDQRILTEFFFDTPADPRTRTPGKEGWTTKVDATLVSLKAGQQQTQNLLNEVLGELRPDGNGGHNLRGVVERGAEAAGAEVIRVRKNEDEAK